MAADVSHWIANLSSSDIVLVGQAAEALAQMGPEAKAAAVPLVRAAAINEETVREWVVSALESLEAPAAEDCPALTELVGSEDPDVAYWAITLLGRLEEKAEAAPGGGGAHEPFRDGEADRHVAVVAARMHPSGDLRHEGKAGRLLERQGVHVGAEEKAPAAGVRAGIREHAGPSDRRLRREAERGEAVGDHAGRAPLVVGELRMGVEVAARGQIAGPLYFNGSVTWSHAEFANGDAIPLAPELTGYGALILRWPEGLTTQLQGTYLGTRPLVEDRSIKSPSWLEFDLSTRYQIPVKLSHGRLEAFLFIQNLFNTKWEQAVFAFESRLRNETTGVMDIHFVPGNPRFVMGGLAWYF